MNIGVTPMTVIQYLRTLFVAVFVLILSGRARQSALSDRARPDSINVRVATPKNVGVSAEVVVNGTVETHPFLQLAAAPLCSVHAAFRKLGVQSFRANLLRFSRPLSGCRKKRNGEF
jgi:hypothetical protein